MSAFATTLWISLGGAVGTAARYWIAVGMLPWSRSLPWGTIVINIVGSFIIGFFGTLTLTHGRHPMPETARLFVMVGLCGGFTTFSSFSLQTLDLLRSGAILRALLNIGASVLLCLIAVAMGHMLGAQLNGGAVAIAQIAIEEEA
jgi:CrcB protein